MPLDLTYGQLRELIDAENLGWQPAADIPDHVRLPNYALGGDPEGLIPTQDVRAVDFHALGPGTNPFLAVRRAERRLLPPEEIGDRFNPALLRRLGLESDLQALSGGVTDEALGEAADLPGDAGVPPASVDWRSRWGRNWITSTRDQNFLQRVLGVRRRRAGRSDGADRTRHVDPTFRGGSAPRRREDVSGPREHGRGVDLLLQQRLLRSRLLALAHRYTAVRANP